MKCINCKAFNARKQECRKHAPQPTINGQQAQWPKVDTEDWCQEFEVKENLDEAA